jgi:hypothetical protein
MTHFNPPPYCEWDGAVLRIQVRLAQGVALRDRVGIQVTRRTKFEGSPLPAMRDGRLRLNWPSATRAIPLRVQLTTTEGHGWDVAVEDLRPAEPGEWLCDAGSPEEMQDAADQMLEEKYDFYDEAGGPPPNGKDSDVATAASGASYSVAAYEDSRRRFAAIDHWIDVLRKADLPMRGEVLADGERIAGRWAAAALTDQRADIASSAALAAEELRGRIRKERQGR